MMPSTPKDSGQLQFQVSQRVLERCIILGLSHLIVSPGSRSTPFLLAADSLKQHLKIYVSIDERSAAFMAMAIARRTNGIVGLLCTSGTAASHYFPALIEANLQAWPIIAFTADRPPHLLHTGSNQTINQENLYGTHTSYFSINPLSQSNSDVDLILTKIEEELRGRSPLQINLHFQKPLEPTSIRVEKKAAPNFPKSTPLSFHEKNLPLDHKHLNWLSKSKKPLFIAGPTNYPQGFLSLYDWVTTHNIPVLAEQASGFQWAISQNKWHNFIHALEDSIWDELKETDLIIRTGQSPTHRSTLALLDELSTVNEIQFNGQLKDKQNPTLKKSIEHLGLAPLKEELESVQPNINKVWVSRLRTKLTTFSEKKNLFFEQEGASTTVLSEADFIASFCDIINHDDEIILSNSLSARNYDLFVSHSCKNRVFTMRGASGIDGWIAQGIGHAIESKKVTHLIIGDVSFQHDASSLELVNRYRNMAHLNIWLINNNGGRIFDRLPIAQQSSASFLETFFYTQPHVDFGTLSDAYSIEHLLFSKRVDLLDMPKHLKSNQPKVFEIRIDPEYSDRFRTLR